MRFTDEDSPVKRPDRPLGVTILTVWDGIFFGIIPIISIVFRLVRGELSGDNPFSLYLTVFLAVLIIMVAFGTYIGNDRSRSFLIYIITIYQCLEAFNSVILLASGSIQTADSIFAVGTILIAFFWIALHVWYFLRPETLEFFRRPK